MEIEENSLNSFLQNILSLFIKNKNLKIHIDPIREEKEFWDLVEEKDKEIKEIEFEEI